MTGETVVLCIGNPFRRDDGVAHAIAERASGSLPAGVAVVELDGEPARIVDAWVDAGTAIVVDAGRSGAPPGTIQRLVVGDDGPASPARPASTHGYGVSDAVALGRVLGRLPDRLVVYTVEGEDYSMGPGLSAAVARSVPDVVARLVDELS